MKDILKELLQTYQEKIKMFNSEINPKLSLWEEFLSPFKTLKTEDTIEQEIDFYSQFEQDMLALPNLRTKALSIDDWKEAAHLLTVHNERLSSLIDSDATLSAMFATLAMISLVLAKTLGPQNWFVFALVVWLAFKLFAVRLEKRRELSRNRELLAIIQNYISKNS